MEIKEFIDRIEKLNDLIGNEKTGTPKQFADRLGINRSNLSSSAFCLADILSWRRPHFVEIQGGVNYFNSFLFSISSKMLIC